MKRLGSILTLTFFVIAILMSASLLSAQRRGGGGGYRGSAQTSVNRPNSNNYNRNNTNNYNRNNNVNNNYNRNTNVNNNVNVNRNVNVNTNVDYHGGSYGGGCWNCGGCCYHPVATAAAVTATAVATAAVVGSIVNTLPPSCSSVVVGGVAYQQCGSSWYQPQFSGGSTTYVVVNAPR